MNVPVLVKSCSHKGDRILNDSVPPQLGRLCLRTCSDGQLPTDQPVRAWGEDWEPGSRPAGKPGRRLPGPPWP